MKKPRILFCAPSAYILGGLATWLDYIVPGLGEKGWDVDLGLTSGKLHNADAYLQIHPLKKAIRIENKTGSREGRIRSIMRAIQNIKPDIVASVNIPDAYVAVERLREKSAASPKTIMTLHGIQADICDDAKEFRNVIDGVICTNKLACEIIRKETGIQENRIYYAPCGVGVPEKIELTNKNNDSLRILYVGRLNHMEKRVFDIPEILAYLEEKNIKYQLVVAGSGADEKAFMEKAGEKNISHRIKMLGAIKYDELIKNVYESADILLVTSNSETGPIVIWEAMAHGLAVVTTRYIGSGLEGALKHGENCLMFPVGDTPKAAECIEALLNDEVRRHIIHNGFKLVKERYSREKSIEYWHEAFRKVTLAKEQPLIKNFKRLPSAGRLDRIFGTGLAETIRRTLGIKFIHNDPGGEWPHSYGKRRHDNEEFLKEAAIIDNGEKNLF